jgi:hypothetical protein
MRNTSATRSQGLYRDLQTSFQDPFVARPSLVAVRSSRRRQVRARPRLSFVECQSPAPRPTRRPGPREARGERRPDQPPGPGGGTSTRPVTTTTARRRRRQPAACAPGTGLTPASHGGPRVIAAPVASLQPPGLRYRGETGSDPSAPRTPYLGLGQKRDSHSIHRHSGPWTRCPLPLPGEISK